MISRIVWQVISKGQIIHRHTKSVFVFCLFCSRDFLYLNIISYNTHEKLLLSNDLFVHITHFNFSYLIFFSFLFCFPHYLEVQ